MVILRVGYNIPSEQPPWCLPDGSPKTKSWHQKARTPNSLFSEPNPTYCQTEYPKLWAASSRKQQAPRANMGSSDGESLAAATYSIYLVVRWVDMFIGIGCKANTCMCLYICLCIYILCLCRCMYKHTDLRTNTCIYIHTHTLIHVYVCVSIYLYVCMHVCVYVCICICIHLYHCISICMCVCISIYMCTSTCAYTIL